MHVDCELLDLSHLGLISLSGGDTRKFLQGQCTSDLRQLNESLTQLSSHCNPNGRMLAMFLLIQRGSEIYLQLPTRSLPSLLERLIKYKLRAQIDIRDVSSEAASIGIAGNATAEIINKCLFTSDIDINFDSIPVNAAFNYPPFILIKQRDDHLRIQILGPIAEILELKNRCINQGARLSDLNSWNLLDIQAGIPTLYPETADAFLPQMLNLHLLGGVSFSKGCYVGQEVIARLQHLGALKRRLFRSEVYSSVCPHPGDRLYADTSESAQGAGKVINAAFSGENRCEMLVVAEIEAMQSSTMRIGSVDGMSLRFLPLPYQI